VQIVPDPHAESGDCKVVLVQKDGKRVELPGVYFGAVSQREVARHLAGQLAKSLGVGVVEGD
jgi:hypothetical protein